MKLLTKIPNFPPRALDAHKGSFGRALIVAGSQSMPGAALLAVGAALRGGAGLVTLAAPFPVIACAPSRVPEAMFLNLSGDWGKAKPAFALTAAKTILLEAERSQAALVGPGMGLEKPSVSLIRKILPQLSCALVLDADGLNALGQDREPLWQRKAKTILTPHPGEIARLLGVDTKTVQSDREGSAVRLARESRAIVVLKGHRSVVTDAQTLYVNETGNPGMATGGMGDVLAGLIVSLLARGLGAFDAAVLGVFLHGFAGDLAAKHYGQESMKASDAIEMLPEAFLRHA